MPVLREDMKGRPGWCELERFAIVAIHPAEEVRWRPEHPANKLVVADGRCRLRSADGERSLDAGDTIDVAPAEHTITADQAATVVELEGHWEAECGGVGIFRVANAEHRTDVGDPVTYPKNTDFDRHYHDCDEYWILVSGGGTAVSEDISYEVGPGDCVATQMGHHHDLPSVAEPVLGVYFETTMRGQRRRGHLWERVHGPAVPP
jgi:mannose-6-phosphate isomerase-like protein (cupin superfamily)